MPRQIVCLLCSLPAAYGPQLRTPQPAAANPLTYQGNRLQRHLLLERLLDLAVPGLSQGRSPRYEVAFSVSRLVRAIASISGRL